MFCLFLNSLLAPFYWIFALTEATRRRVERHQPQRLVVGASREQRARRVEPTAVDTATMLACS